MTGSGDRVSVCICTFHRPWGLSNLLLELERQFLDQPFPCSVVVVDNDRLGSAREVVCGFKESAKFPVDYHIEPEQNVSLARNRAIAASTGNVIVLIDDDEIPGEGWLRGLYETYRKSGADCVLGPVKPSYETEPPGWIVKGKMHERESLETGTIVKDVLYTRTGNVLMSRRMLDGAQDPFDPRLGRSGGEDTAFFRRKIDEGCILVWCDEACVHETIPPERLRRSYFLKRALLRGVVNGRGARSGWKDPVKSIAAVALYTFSLPFLFLAGQHHFMKYLVRDCDHIGKLFAIVGIDLVKERNF